MLFLFCHPMALGIVIVVKIVVTFVFVNVFVNVFVTLVVYVAVYVAVRKIAKRIAKHGMHAVECVIRLVIGCTIRGTGLFFIRPVLHDCFSLDQTCNEAGCTTHCHIRSSSTCAYGMPLLCT